VELQVLFEDNHLLAVYKPAGIPSQGDNTGDQSIVDLGMEYLRVKYEKPGNIYCALVHRLDRPVAGVLVLAKTSKAAARLSEQFQKSTIQKRYIALCEQAPRSAEGELVHYLRRQEGKNLTLASAKPRPDAQEARLRYRHLGNTDQAAVIRVEPLTGRQHQIRVQLSAIHCPIIGDVKYGAHAPLPNASIALLAWQIEFEHPTTKEIKVIDAPLPAGPLWLGVANLL
jgi:23S rRNA pseudouridine1911/1915/1917 synthase